MNHTNEFDGKKLVSTDSADVKLEAAADKDKADDLNEDEAKKLCEWLKNSLGDKVAEVNLSDRLVDSPAVALNADKFMTPGMRRMMKAMHQDVPTQLPIHLEINPGHSLIKRLNTLKDQEAEFAGTVAAQLYDNALIAAGFLDDPRSMVNRLNQILERATEAKEEV